MCPVTVRFISNIIDTANNISYIIETANNITYIIDTANYIRPVGIRCISHTYIIDTAQYLSGYGLQQKLDSSISISENKSII